MLKMEQEPKYNIVKGKLINRETGNKIPDDEPIFIFRGQDAHLVKVLMEYRKLAKGRHKKVIQTRINQVRAWQKANKDRVKEPDSTAGELVAAQDMI
jgi:hypothetical protein